MPDIKTIADNANIVVNGYAFTREEDGIHVLNLNMLAESAATDVADTEQLFRLIQSIPSKKAEPFKQWMAQVA